MGSPVDLVNGGIGLGESMTGTVRWFKNEKGYGRITGDDDYFYWVHFSAIEVEGYKTLAPGQRVTFEWRGGRADHGRKAAENVRPIDHG
jgi:CspA family cold shock protein